MRATPTLLLLACATQALASDGVLEINQTCAVETGCFAGDTAGLPVTISASGSYRLTSNLVVPDENTDGIRVITSDVGIDLNNFAIQGGVTCSGFPVTCAPSGSGDGVQGPFSQGLSVENGNITGMGRSGVDLGFQATVTNLRVRWNGRHGIAVNIGSTVMGSTAYENANTGITSSGSGSTLSANVVSANGSDGISAFGGATIQNNSVQSNGVDGIVSSISANGSTVSGNAVVSNLGNGIVVGPGSTVTGNTVRANTVDGIAADAGSTVSRNAVTSNLGAGIRATGGGSSIFDNTVRANGGDGIDCTDGGRSYVRGNSAIENTGFGINLADAGAPDGLYRDNLVYDNAGGTVNGGLDLNRGGNSCRNLSGGISDCP